MNILLLPFIMFVAGYFIVLWNTEEKKEINIFLGTVLVMGGMFLGDLALEQDYVRDLCEREQISYELVEATAKYANVTEVQAAHVFAAVDEIMEPLEAIMLLDKNLTEEDALAILQLSDKKQAE